MKSIFQVLSWSLSSLGKGYNPERRHDGRHWLKSLDKARAGQAGMPLPFKAALIQIRADGIGISIGWVQPHGTRTVGCVGCAGPSPMNGDQWAQKKERRIA